MKIFKKMIALLCCGIIAFSMIFNLSACKGEDNSSSETQETDIAFVQNGKSRYKILIPDEALEKEIFAAQELQHFVKEATDCELTIVRESQLASADCYLSIGQTECLQERNISQNSDKLGRSGYRIISDDKYNVYLFGADNGVGEGTIYSVYGFLKEMVDYTYYSDATIYYLKKQNLNIKKFNLEKIPRFDIRYVNTMKTWNDATYMYRMGWTSREDYSDKLSGHTHFVVLNPDIYYEAHKDWYFYSEKASKPVQLCLSNLEMRKEFSKRLLEYVKSEDEKTVFSLGIVDNIEYCTCENCTAAVELYGSFGGLYINFCNAVTEETDLWLSKNQPEREVEYLCQLYYSTEVAPVIQNSDGSYSAKHKDAIPKSNMRLMIAGIETRIRNKALDDEVNVNMFEIHKRWGALSNNIQSYNYACSYHEHGYMYAINDFVNVERDMELYEQYGVRDLYYTFGYRTTDTACLYDLKAYCISQLMWGTEKSYQELAREFMEYSYLDAADSMWAFYEDYRLHMTAAEKDFPSKNTSNTARAFDGKLLPRAFINKLQGYIDAAYASIEKYKTEDVALYEQLNSKINKEEIMTLYIFLNSYSSTFTVEQRRDMISRLTDYAYKHNILRSAEGVVLKTELELWEQNLN